MRSSFVAALLFFVTLPLVNVSAQQAYVDPAVGTGCGCGTAVSVATPCATCEPCNTCNTRNTCDTCGTVDGCGCSSCGSLCDNPALFYEVLYAEFYARNPWYLEHRARESAARRARLYGQYPDAATPPPYSPGPIKAPKSSAKPAGNTVKEPIKPPAAKVAEPNKVPETK